MALAAVKKWFGRVETKGTLASPDASFLEIFGAQPVSSGVSVSVRSALRVAPVACAVQTISAAVGQLSVPVYAVEADNSKQLDTKHPVHKLLNDAANPWTPASELREALTADALCFDHGGVAFINRVNGKPVELLRLDPNLVTVETDAATGEPRYFVSETQGRKRPIAGENVLHIRPPNGIAPLTQAREAIGLCMVLERHAARLFANGARPGGILSFKSPLTPEGLQKAKAAWVAAHGGDRSGGTAVMDGDAAFTALTLSSVDAQFLELRKFQIEELCRCFRVPPHLLFELGRATWNNGKNQGRAFVDYSLARWIKAWQGEIRLKLFSPEGRDLYCAEFDTDDLSLPDLAERAAAYTHMIAARVLNPNEARELERRAPYAGGDKFDSFHLTPAGGVGNAGAAA